MPYDNILNAVRQLSGASGVDPRMVAPGLPPGSPPVGGQPAMQGPSLAPPPRNAVAGPQQVAAGPQQLSPGQQQILQVVFNDPTLMRVVAQTVLDAVAAQGGGPAGALNPGGTTGARP